MIILLNIIKGEVLWIGSSIIARIDYGNTTVKGKNQ
jgi:hypothetical protein